MEKRPSVGPLALPYPLRTGALGAPRPPARLPARDAFRVSARRDAAECWERVPAGCARRRPCRAPPLEGAREPALLRQRNERERQRVRGVNEGYARLRDHLPRELAGRRLSKVETLRAAIGYIRRLQELLERHARRPDCGSDGESKASSAPSPCSEPEDRG
uniref:achaete-scute homolog 4 n=1 Tax=Jaculus jaculus TaxID=51337 RepID=UPI001E1B10BD|nr:achaete-scute homolog 4 [Jaculus jaculus]